MICICPNCGNRFNPNLYSNWKCPKCGTDFSNNKEALCPKKDEAIENVEKPKQEKPIDYDLFEKSSLFLADFILSLGIVSATVATYAFFDEDEFVHRNFWADRFYIVAGILMCSIFFNLVIKILVGIVHHLHELNSSIKNPSDSKKEHLQ